MPPAVHTMQRAETRDGKSVEGGALAAAARMADQAARAIGRRSRRADGRIHRAAERLIRDASAALRLRADPIRGRGFPDWLTQTSAIGIDARQMSLSAQRVHGSGEAGISSPRTALPVNRDD